MSLTAGTPYHGGINIASINGTEKITASVNNDEFVIKDSEASGELKTIKQSNLSIGDADVKVSIDSAATADYIGAASNDGVLRVNSTLDYTDGGNFVTVGLDSTLKTNYDAASTHASSDGKNHSDVVLNNTHRTSNGSDHTYIDQSVVSGASPTFDGANLSGIKMIKSITIEAPTASEDKTVFFTPVALTITEMRAVLVGSSTPSVTWTIRHNATDRSAAGTEVVTGGTTTTSVSAGSDVTSFDDATIPADSFVWIETTAKSGTVNELHVSIVFDYD